ncbi:Formin-like protein 3 [Porphyridium purpureum]|uniref:Formin-like protein 3 n=1 Tax=Porphyridium purpureum TaxID=35688 RepID=A0A5J4YTK7_PORPP|nr:Formin-like protein 3 [Porphyridium purpureum]|eukprot:POR5390..scf227_4
MKLVDRVLNGARDAREKVKLGATAAAAADPTENDAELSKDRVRGDRARGATTAAASAAAAPAFSTRTLVGQYQGYKLYERTNETKDLVFFDDAGNFAYTADAARFGRKTGIPALNNDDLLKITSFRYVPKAKAGADVANDKSTANEQQQLPYDASRENVFSNSQQALDEARQRKLLALAELDTYDVEQDEAELQRQGHTDAGVAGPVPPQMLEASAATAPPAHAKLQAPPVPMSSATLVTLHWTKVRAEVVPGSIWDRLDVSFVQLDAREIEKLFSVVVKRSDIAQESEQATEILPFQRRLGISIVRSTLNMEPPEILEAARSGSCMNMTEETCTALLSLTPTDTELGDLQAKQYLVDRVDETDAFMLELAREPMLRECVTAALQCITFASNYDALVMRMKVVADACKEVLESTRLGLLLQIMLALGNTLNRDSKTLQNAKAVRIDQVMHLAQARSSRGDLTAFDVLVEVLLVKFPELVSIKTEMKVLYGNVDRLGIDSLKDQYDQFLMSKELVVNIVRQLSTAELRSGYPGIIARLNKFLESSSGGKKAELATKMHAKMNERLEKVMVLFCEKAPKSVSRQTDVFQALVDIGDALMTYQERAAWRRANQIRLGELSPDALAQVSADGDCSSVPLRNVHWTKIGDKLMTPEAIWQRSHSGANIGSDLFDPRVLAFYFGKSTAASVPLAVGSVSSSAAAGIREVLDARRKYMVAILVATIQPTPEQAIAMFLDPRLGLAAEETTVSALAQLAPEEHEIAALLQVPREQLDATEQYVRDLSQSPHAAMMKPKLEAILVMQGFQSNARLVVNDMNIMFRACEEIVRSQRLKRFLAVVLQVGNFLNQNHGNKGSALGFKIESMAGLLRTKSPLKAISLFEYVVRVAQRSARGNTRFESVPLSVELPTVSDAAAKDMETMLRVCSELDASLKTFKALYSSGEVDLSSELAAWEGELQRVRETKHKLEIMLAALCCYLGEKPVGPAAKNLSPARLCRRGAELIQMVHGFCIEEPNIVLTRAIEAYTQGTKRAPLQAGAGKMGAPQQADVVATTRPDGAQRDRTSVAMSFYIRTSAK